MMKSIKLSVLFAISVFTLNLKAQSVQDGLKYLDAEQYTKAETSFQSLVKSQPTAENYYYLGYFYLQTDKPDLAKPEFEKGLTIDPNNALNIVGLGTVALAKGSKSEAQTQFTKAITMTKSKKADVLYRIGEAYTYFPEDEKKRDVAEAIRILNLAAKIDAKNSDTYLALGDAYLIPNDGSNAETNYMKAREVNPKSAKSFIRSGNIYIRAKAYSEALDLYKKGLAVDPNYASGYRQIAELYFRAGRYTDANVALNKYIELSDNKNEAKLLVGKSLFLSARQLQEDKKTADAVNTYKDAIKYIKEIENIPNIDPVIYRILGYSYFESKEPKAKNPQECEMGAKAMETFFQKFDKTKIITSDYAMYGKLLSCSGKDSLALIELDKASFLDTMDHEIIKLMGDINGTQKKFDKQALHYSKVVLRKGDKVTVNDYFYLGRAYYFAKDYEKADTTFGTMIEKCKTTPTGYPLAYLYKARTKSLLDYKLNLDNINWLAYPYYEKYIVVGLENKEKEKKNLVEAYKYIGGYYLYSKNDLNKALETWKKGLEIDPDSQDLKDQIKKATAPQPQQKTTTPVKKTGQK